MLGACNGRGAYFLTYAGSLTEGGLNTASGLMFNMFSSSTAGVSSILLLNNFEFVYSDLFWLFLG